MATSHRPTPMGSKRFVLDQGSTLVPNSLLDSVMPRLRDTEWRVLCVVIRQTIGWMNPDGSPKQSDWMSHSQLRRKTGRSSAAISLALEFLCRNNVLEITDSLARPLKRAYERRSHRGRLHFRLNPAILSGEPLPRRFKGRFRKAARTKDTHVVAAVVHRDHQKRKSGIRKEQKEWGNWNRVGKLLRTNKQGQTAPSPGGH